MLTSDLDFELPTDRISRGPLPWRDRGRLMVLDRATGKIEHRGQRDLAEVLAGLPVVVNDSKLHRSVLKLWRDTGHQVALVLEAKLGPTRWEAQYVGSHDLLLARERTWYTAPGGLRVEFLEDLGGGRWRISFESEPDLLRIGSLPLGPKVRRPASPDELAWYEPAYAEKVGGWACPTAGVPIAPETLARLNVDFLTLHATQRNLRKMLGRKVEDHAGELLPEPYEIPRPPAGPVVAIGTTVVRALEAYARTGAAAGQADGFVRPGVELPLVRGLLTNFHYPRETLLALACAVGGTERVVHAHKVAVQEGYRMSDYGDSLLIV